MRWRKLGLVHGAGKPGTFRHSHAMLPTPHVREQEGVVRVFFTACDPQGLGRPFYVDLAMEEITRVVREVDEPLLDVGRPGTFDENGAVATSVVDTGDGRLLMYYVGFELGTKIRYRLLTGAAISHDGGETFVKHRQTPILERSEKELFFRCGPFVAREGGRYRMWYVAGDRWVDVQGKSMPEYRIKYLESDDGLSWEPEGRIAIDVSRPDEHGFGRPWVERDLSGYRMFYSVRLKSVAAYRMGYAESADGFDWIRKDEQMGLDVGPDWFDDAAIMYAATVQIDGRTYCFYNGNDFGRDGFAVAVREDA